MRYIKIPENLHSLIDAPTLTFKDMGMLLVALMDFGFNDTITESKDFDNLQTYAIYEMLINDERNWE